jgi:hypothetical protein
MSEPNSPSTGEVFDDHLGLAQNRSFDEDIERSFIPDCIVPTGRGAFNGHDGLRTPRKPSTTPSTHPTDTSSSDPTERRHRHE